MTHPSIRVNPSQIFRPNEVGNLLGNPVKELEWTHKYDINSLVNEIINICSNPQQINIFHRLLFFIFKGNQREVYKKNLFFKGVYV